jgi:hypothetical protein
MFLYDSRFCLAALAALMLSLSPALAQTASPAAPAKPTAPKAIKLGDVLSGQLNAIRSRGKKGRKAPPTFQLVSEPRRLPPPGDLCNLETGPETFQITATDAQAAQLKPLIGKQVALKIEAISCAEEAGVMSEAMVTKWSLVK